MHKRKDDETPEEQPADYSESRNQLVDKIIKSLRLKENDIAEMVELYYDCQELRIKHGNRERTEPPSTMVIWLQTWLNHGENVIAGKLRHWVEGPEARVETKWAYNQVGIGPIIAAGLSAHIDVLKAKHISSVWKFAGLAPGYDRRVKGQKLPYNSRLKVLAWKLGQSFVKVSGKKNAFYGHLYAAFKDDEVRRNEEGRYKEAAARELATKTFKKDNPTKKRLLEGKLSDAHLHSRACRRTVKVFLAHFYQIARKGRGLDPGTPYVAGILKHENMIEPDWPEGLEP